MGVFLMMRGQVQGMVDRLLHALLQRHRLLHALLQRAQPISFPLEPLASRSNTRRRTGCRRQVMLQSVMSTRACGRGWCGSVQRGIGVG